MEFSFSLKKQDFLDYYMFVEGKSEKIKNRLRIKQFVAPAFYFIFGLVMLIRSGSTTVMILLDILAVLWIIIYPIIFQIRLKNYYDQYIDTNHANRINEPTSVKLEDNSIIMTSRNITTKYYWADLDNRIENYKHVFLVFKDKSFLILPKKVIPADVLRKFPA